MILKDYLYYNKIKVKDFAPTVPIAKESLSSYMAGKIRISRQMAKCIAYATHQKVSIFDLLEANPPKKGKSIPTKEKESLCIQQAPTSDQQS